MKKVHSQLYSNQSPCVQTQLRNLNCCKTNMLKMKKNTAFFKNVFISKSDFEEEELFPLIYSDIWV